MAAASPRQLRTKRARGRNGNTPNSKNSKSRESSAESTENADRYSCAVCCAFFTAESDSNQTNLMVFCDRCDVSVHQYCYGYPLTPTVPKDEWICDLCNSEESTSAQCVLCPMEGGAMKRTTCWRWCHLQCAMFMPEAFFRIPDSNECIDVLKVPQRRFRNQCCYCGIAKGATVDCCQANCGRTYHVSCAFARNVC